MELSGNQGLYYAMTGDVVPLIDKYGRPQLLVWPDTPAIPIHLRGKQKGIMQVLKERNLWPKMEGAVMGLIFFFSVQKTQTGLDAVQTKESMAVVHVVY